MKARTLLAFTGALACVCATLFATPTADNTPDKFVRYVEATGSQYVDTGIVGRYNTKAECKVEWMNFTDSAFLACGDWSASKRFFMCYCRNTSGNMMTAQGTGDNVRYNDADLLLEKKRVYTYLSESTAADGDNVSTNIVTIDGTKVFTKGYSAIDTGRNLYVFACNQKANTVIGKSQTRCYGLTIWQGSAEGGAMSKVREFKPCVKNGRAGLYDTVSETIFYSASGTDLTYDKNCDVPDAFIDYVESFGNSYIDTKVTGRSGTAAKMEMAFMESADQGFLEARKGSGGRFYLFHNYTNNKWLYGYGGYYSFGSYESGRKYYVESSLASGSQVIKVGEGGPDAATATLVDKTDAATIDTGLNMYLFKCNYDGSALYGSKARVYWLQIFQDGKMVRDFRPCLKYGEAALYDDVSKTIFYPEGDPLGYDNSVAANADELVFVDYIESDGFTHLDTQVAANSPTRATGVFSWTQMRTTTEEAKYLDESHHSYLACGYWNSDSDANRFYMIDQTEQYFWVGYGNNKDKWSSIGKAAVDEKYFFDISFAAGSQPFTLAQDGATTTNSYTWTWSGDASGCSNLYLFACNDAKNKKPIYRSAARCYGLTIYQGGETPVRNFKPCVKDGQAALYDTVSKRLFYPVPAIPAEGNTGAITEESALSPVEAYLEYVETDKTQYIDTGVVGKAGTTAEFVETSLCDNQDVEECFLGSVTASWQTERFYMWYHRTKFALGLGYGSEYWTPSLKDPTAKVSDWNPATNSDAYPLPNGTKTHARVSFAAGSQRVVVVNDATGAGTVVADRALADDIDTGRNLYLFANNNNGTAASFAKSRLYWLKIKQNGAYVRKFQPVRLKNGLVGLWDFVEKKTYLPKTSTGGLAYFSAVGPEAGKLFNKGFVIIVR